MRSAPPSRAPLRPARKLALTMALALSSSLFVATEARAAGVPIEQATAEQKASAQQAFQAGIRLFDAKQFGPAFKEFSGSYDIVKSPNAHFMMARCLTEMGELARAFNELLVAEDEARASPKYKTTLNESSQLRQELARKVAVIVITLKGSEQASVTVDGAQVPLRKQHAISPGEVEIVATVHGEARKRERVNLLPGDVRPITIDIGNTSDGSSGATPPPGGGPGDGNGEGPGPETPSTSSGSSGTGWYVAGGITGGIAVGLGVATLVYGIPFSNKRANNARNDDPPTAVERDYNREHAGETCASSRSPFDCAALSERTKTIGFGIAAGVTAILGTTFIIVGATRGDDGEDGDGEPSAVNVEVVPGPTGISVLGTF